MDTTRQTEAAPEFTGHTPGPWTHEDGQSVYSASGAETRLIAECHAGHAPERTANARLIAAAPDLAAALRGLLAASRPGQDPVVMLAATERARAALARAEGGRADG